ncbi:type II toxin-antitoxin system Phd/YefM family antitoxin [Candidatus Bandiella numerosa]|uniref:type II toxin-antitoxin system Phd/YefM family antitoxin n=1 Tax=Candidatus Bandiella numerosa TaxID=2570586 RepID=UPI001F32C8C4|nr:type II toxin-antitoxin system Phd/YefM family antitoxin [Candidatus Bandiella numerosa]
MAELILSNITASITELKANPMKTVETASGEAIAILNRNKPAFYCVPADAYEEMVELLDDIKLSTLVKDRAKEEEVEVKLNEL